ncbi:MAG TPA: type II toxin-antitoxin system PemK/MazF family toxin [Candidatus Limnocylindrales bacterium]|nr:type II toxin-antitoxin system PemK/MazF family toxin [Candidatus Limnocylindrales bacterium]
MAAVERWSIVILDLDPVVGHEQAGRRRALVVSYEPFHRSGMATVCPITSRAPKYPGEIAVPAGHAGQTLDGAILVHQIRTIDVRRLTAAIIGGAAQTVTDPAIRRDVRRALAHHLGLDVPTAADGAAPALVPATDRVTD